MGFLFALPLATPGPQNFPVFSMIKMVNTRLGAEIAG
jgi:hypothetical protein